MNYESIAYGRPNEPGGLTRDSNSNYFNFESDRTGIMMNWSTPLAALECYQAAVSSFPNLALVRRSKRSIIGIESQWVAAQDELALAEAAMMDAELEEDTPLDGSVAIVDVSTPEALDLMRQNATNLIVARLAFKSLDLFWHSPYVRFIDSDHKVAQAGIYTRHTELIKPIGQFARATGTPGFLDAANVKVQSYWHGGFKEFDV